MHARDLSFGEVVLDRRLTLGLTQDALAEQVGVTRYVVHKVESGGYSLGWDELGCLADALQTKLSDMFQAPSVNVVPGSDL